MPPQVKITKDMILDAALCIVREEGHEHLSARRVSEVLRCSTQPVMYQFPELAKLRELVYQKADQYHTAYLFSAEGLLGIGLKYVQFAAEEPNLFRLLFQSGHFDGASLTDMVAAPEVAAIVQTASLELGLVKEDALSAFEALFVAVHGYASLIANNAMKYDPATIEKTLTAIAEGLLKEESES